ncbi:putative O-glycosylation ligase, exosortase A system-associated [Novosphingobium sp. JCM 18896]|uniref:putative O-glycosylation ligase, exosortase A system-associated n=1 Tax=Novosphingobium sp. JCM 18896 TaxID=2989731 RepID=UPI0022225663|nr:putative O-glycosylation ligase, exosortase A system-associated [Novosphingobium sp. JCM 18896]MCW1431832.1 putative O-glycosylation ligase, exosortase A system-associated [Novosphingobium sp. JCM 18896]
MTDYTFFLFFCGFVALGFKRPFLWVLCYCYVDIVSPQKASWHLLASLPVSLIVFAAAFGGWLLVDDKRDSRFTYRQGILCALLVYCGYTTFTADFPVEALGKWDWVWKALLWAIILPLTLRTRLRIEATALVIVLSLAAIIIPAAIKTVLGGGGYGMLRLLVDDNTGLFEGSTIAMAAIAAIPLIWWLVRFGTIFPKHWTVTLFAVALTGACMLMPIGTQARTGLVCLAVLGLLVLRTAKRRFLYMALGSLALFAAIPFLPKSFTDRMNTIENHKADQSASTRLAVWAWTWNYAKDHPGGGGFEVYRANKVRYRLKTEPSADAESEPTYIEEAGRAFHSSYFEMLGEQGWPGLTLWLWLQVSGLWQMERLRRKWRKRSEPDERWVAPLANALQMAQVVYLVGALFTGIAYQPFVLMLVGLQCGLWSYLKRIEKPVARRLDQRPRPAPLVAAPEPVRSA